MRPLELTLIVLLLAWGGVAAASLKKRRPAFQRVLLALLCLTIVAQVILEGWRLQMAPAYFAILLVAVSSLNISDLITRVFLCVFVTLCALVSLAGGYAFPVFTLPQPQGPYAVGTFVVHTVDRGRHERHSDLPNAPREFMIQVWYPAKHERGKRAWYRDPRMNTWRSDHLRLVQTHSFWNLPVAEQPQTFPVLLFSPSSGGNRDQNTFETEELASQGYVVVGMDHPYSCSRVVFPDGRVIHSLGPWMDLSSRAAYEASCVRDELMVEDHVGDARFVLDEMERWNRPGSGQLLSGRLSLTKAGVFGHSFGGALAGALCLADPRVVAGINMDGWMFGDAESKGIPKPFFFMNSGSGGEVDPAAVAKLSGSDRLEGEKDLAYARGMASSLERFGGYRLTILGSVHGNYSDLILFTRPLPFRENRALNPYRVFQIVNAFTLAFFDRYVRGRPAPLLDAGGFSGEVRYKVYRAPAISGS
jgi:pimeloyl-ACP methyl ester carboxylesterase